MKMKVQKRRPFHTALKILLAVALILCALLLLWRPAGKMIYRDFYRIAEEGVRINFPDGWCLLRKSLHDPILPMNMASDSAGGCEAILAVMKEFLAGYPELEL